MINLDFGDTYSLTYVSEDFTVAEFFSTQKDNSIQLLRINIEPFSFGKSLESWNLSFGPLDAYGAINDLAKLNHVDTGKVLSTVVLFAITFSDKYSWRFIGLDGSNQARSRLYHLMFRTNREKLTELLTIVGVDFYARLLKNGKFKRDQEGHIEFNPIPLSYNFERQSNDQYWYYMFKSKIA